MSWTRITRTHVIVLIAMVVVTAASVSAHVVKGLVSPDSATAFVSSPTSTTDAPVVVKWTTSTTVVDTGLRVACFHAANTSSPRADHPNGPRLTSIGFEPPGSPSGFTLLSASDGGDWEIIEGAQAILPGHGLVTLAFARVDIPVERVVEAVDVRPGLDLRSVMGPGSPGGRPG